MQHGVFATAEEAVAACRSIVDGYLTDAFKPGMTADALFESYTCFGKDPFIVPESPSESPIKFSAWDYARQRKSLRADWPKTAQPGFGRLRITDGLAPLPLRDRFLDDPASPFRINLLPDSRSSLKARKAAFSAGERGGLDALLLGGRPDRAPFEPRRVPRA